MKYFHPDLMDKGLQELKTVAQAGNLRLVLLSQGSSVVSECRTLYDGGAGKYRLSNEVTVNNADITLQNRTGGGREAAIIAKSGTAAATIGGTPDLHVALLDVTAGQERVLFVTDETSNQPITSGNPINFPAFAPGFSNPV